MNEEQFTQAVNAVTTIAMVLIMLTIFIAVIVTVVKSRGDPDADHRLMPLLVILLVVQVAGSAVLFWPQIRDFDYGAVAPIAVSAVSAIVGGGAVGLWMFRKKK